MLRVCKLRRVGDSLVISIPVDMCQKLGWAEDDHIVLTTFQEDDYPEEDTRLILSKNTS